MLERIKELPKWYVGLVAVYFLVTLWLWAYTFIHEFSFRIFIINLIFSLPLAVFFIQNPKNKKIIYANSIIVFLFIVIVIFLSIGISYN